eukprot:CAMPEP_0198717680 /NCGR_PEP_ID=MMETSP1471-20131121/45948_1 /TAXON_ID=41880 /ORGANISM="Pycnococcus provasolii, Strain RCC733" /LENGTH=81 /DNA_ID=CAMNT_0044478291 /DNA_START=17 /DNA_END=262 /DNA_ORIENTATION=-
MRDLNEDSWKHAAQAQLGTVHVQASNHAASFGASRRDQENGGVKGTGVASASHLTKPISRAFHQLIATVVANVGAAGRLTE